MGLLDSVRSRGEGNGLTQLVQPPYAENRTYGGVGALAGAIPSGRPDRCRSQRAMPDMDVLPAVARGTRAVRCRSQRAMPVMDALPSAARETRAVRCRFQGTMPDKFQIR